MASWINMGIQWPPIGHVSKKSWRIYCNSRRVGIMISFRVFWQGFWDILRLPSGTRTIALWLTMLTFARNHIVGSSSFRFHYHVLLGGQIQDMFTIPIAPLVFGAPHGNGPESNDSWLQGALIKLHQMPSISLAPPAVAHNYWSGPWIAASSCQFQCKNITHDFDNWWTGNMFKSGNPIYNWG